MRNFISPMYITLDYVIENPGRRAGSAFRSRSVWMATPSPPLLVDGQSCH